MRRQSALPSTDDGVDGVEKPPIGIPARPFKPRTYPVGAFEVRIKGDAGASEDEIWIEQVGDRVLILTGDAAIQRRIAQQQGTAYLEDAPVQTSAPRRASAAVNVPDRLPDWDIDAPYTGVGPEPEEHRQQRLAQQNVGAPVVEKDPQDALLEDVGMDLSTLATDLGVPV